MINKLPVINEDDIFSINKLERKDSIENLSYLEKFLFIKKLNYIKELEVICTTGSYGKISIKNFVEQILSKKFRVHATPRSVNTLGGIMCDVKRIML